MGATIQNFTQEMAEAQGLDQKGAIVSDLVAGGPAERAGLQTGDVVVGINGKPVTSSSELTRNVAQAQAGDNLRLDVIRDGKRIAINVRSGLRPSEKELAQSANDNDDENPTTPDGPSVQRPVVIGMGLAPLDETLRRRYQIPATVRGGAVITSVRSDSDAGEKGLRAGDVIVSAANRNVSSASDVAAAVDAAKKANRPSVLLGVSRSGRTLYVPIKIAD